MSLHANSEATVVSRLRLTHAGRDPLAARLRVASLLESADLRPARLARTAVVCVKRLRDPLPGALSTRRASAARVPEEWRRAVVASIEELIRGAARPAREAVPASAECVVFEDRAELLACMARDLCEGSLAARWWWGGLLKYGRGARAVSRAWLDAPEYAPPALSRLARAGRASEFARTLAPSEAREIFEAVARRFALEELHCATTGAHAAAAHDAAHSPQAARSVAGASASGLDDAGREAEPEAPAPWRALAPEAEASGSEVARQLFVGVCLSLERAPSAARSPQFARAAGRWHAAAATREEKARTQTRAAAEVPAAQTRDDARRAATSEPGAGTPARARVTPVARVAPEEDEGRGVGESQHAPAARVQAKRGEAATRPRVLSQESVADARDATERAYEDAEASDAAATADAEVPKAAGVAEGSCETEADTAFVEETRQDEWPEMEPLVERKIETELGGLFFLLNVGLSLNLYGDFTTPRAPCLPLAVWEFVELLGRALAGAEKSDDAVWGLLARLAGRGEFESPGRDFEPADEWRVSADWLVPFGGARGWRWSAEGGRLRVLHPAGFFVVDVPLDADASAQLTREMKPYGLGEHDAPDLDARGVAALVAQVGPVAHVAPVARDESEDSTREAEGVSKAAAFRGAPRIGDAAARWLARLVPYVRARLSLALGVADADEAARLVLFRRARVVVTAARVDVQFSLDALPVEVRISGLDRDPGWLPSAGRHVFFHFD